MRKIFNKEEAQKLQFADPVHVWIYINNEFKIDNYHWNCLVWKIYGTRLDIHGLSKKDWGLTWDTYGTKWLLSTPNNSYNKRSNVTVEDIKCYLEKGSD